MTTEMNGYGIGRVYLWCVYCAQALLLMFCMFSIQATAEEADHDSNKQDIEGHGSHYTTAAKNLIDAINSSDPVAFSKLFCSEKAYLKYRIPENEGEGISELVLKRAYETARINFTSDIEAFNKDGNGYSKPLNLKYISSRLIGPSNENLIDSIEIKVEYGNSFGVGYAYIITGSLVRENTSWCFINRCREIHSRYPASKKMNPPPTNNPNAPDGGE